MTHDEHDVVKVYTGPLVTVELYQQALRDAGIESKVVGTELTAGLGTAIPESVELWVKSEDFEKAKSAIELYEKNEGA
ncbi:MAG: DUF2007 domain-containing protein [Planctomycetia bacterium]|nr:DUF2007 domain-containing protein [Planctomycetia bacterium]